MLPFSPQATDCRLATAVAMVCVAGFTAPAQAAVGSAARAFDVPAGVATQTLRLFADQAGIDVVFATESTTRVRTNAVSGKLVPQEAMTRLLHGTGLVAEQNPRTGAFTVLRKSASPGQPPVAAPPPPAAPSKSPQTTLTPTTMKPRSLLATLAGWLAFSGTPAGAQSASTAAKEEAVVLSPFTVSTSSTGRYQATEATSGSRVRISLMDSTQSVAVVTRELIEDIGAARVLDAAKYVSGVYESTIPNALERTSVRGFQSDGATIDGFNYVSFGNVDPALIERIEVVKGPNAILAPQGVPGGTVNIVTKKPRFNDSGSLSAQVGRYNANRAELDFNRVVLGGKGAVRLVGGFERSEHLAGGDYKNSTTVMPMFTYRLGARTEITLQSQIFNTWGGAYGGLPIDQHIGTNDEARYGVGVPADLDLYGKLASRHSSGQYYRVLVTTSFNDQFSMRILANAANYNASSVGINLSNPIGGQMIVRNESNGTFAWNGTTRNDNPSFSRGGSIGYDQRRGYNLQHDFVHDVKFDGARATTVAGYAIDYSRAPFQSTNLTLPNFTLRSFTLTPYTLTTPGANHINYRKAQQIYLNETLSLLGDRLKLNAGVARSSYVNYQTDFFPGRIRTNGITPSATLPSFGVLFKPVPGVALFAGTSKQATAQFVSSTFTPGTLTQDSKQWEVGARVQLLEQRIFATLTYFDIKQNNFGVPNPLNSAVPAPNPFLPPVLTDRIAHGMELEFTLVLTKQFSLVGNATSMKNRDVDNVVFRGTAEKSAAAWANYTGEKGGLLDGWSFGLGFDYLAKRPGDIGQAFTTLSRPNAIIRQQPSFYLPARTIVGAKASYRLDKNWKAQLNVDNLLNEDYLAAGTSRNTVFPGTPINPRLSVTYTF